MGIGLIYMVLMKYCSGYLIWGAIILYFILLDVLGYVCYVEYKNTDSSEVLSEGGKDFGNKKQAMLAGAIFCWSISALTLLLVWCNFKRIKLAVSIIKVTADFIEHEYFLYFIPPVLIVITAGFYAFWIYAVIYLYSSGEVHKYETTTPFGGITWNNNIKNFLFYMIFAVIWISELLFAIAYFIIASTACIWYFN